MTRTTLAIVGYALTIVIASGLSIFSFVQAEEWREWNPAITTMLQIAGVLLVACALLLAYLAMMALTRNNIGDEL